MKRILQVPLLLRKIRKAKWYKNPDVPWLSQKELQADALGDIATAANKLSVYLIEEDKSNLNRVIAALAVQRGNSANFDYALFDLNTIDLLQLEYDRTKGETLDARVNDWHYDLKQLTASKLLELAYTIRGSEISRCREKMVLEIIEEAVASKFIDKKALEVTSPNIYRKLNI